MKRYLPDGNREALGARSGALDATFLRPNKTKLTGPPPTAIAK